MLEIHYPPSAPDPPPWIRHGTVTYRVPKVWTQHNFAGAQVLVLRHQVWAAPKIHYVLSQILLCPFSLYLSLAHCKPCVTGSGDILALVTLQTFYLGKHDLLTVYLGKFDFLSVTDFSLGNLPRGNFIVWVLDMSRKQ